MHSWPDHFNKEMWLAASLSFQILTIFFAGIVITTTILQYNNWTGQLNFSQFFEALAQSLGFLLAVYVYLVAVGKREIIANVGARAGNMQVNFYKLFALVLILLAWILVFVSNPTASWNRVQDNVAKPIANGSLFALPLIFFGTL